MGDVYRPENIPGFVFEEVTVRSVTQTVDGPQGPISGAMLVEEMLIDSVLEETRSSRPATGSSAQVVSENELVNVSIGVPLDAGAGGGPAEVDQLTTASAEIYTAAGASARAAVTTL